MSLAGGIFASAQILDGKYVLLANVQNPSGHNTIAVYEIGRINSMVATDRKHGEIQPNESVTIVIGEYVTETGDFNATVKYHIANVLGDQSDGLDIAISAVVPECEAVQQLTATTDNYTKVILEWQPVELGIYDSVKYLVFCDNSQYAIDTTTETSITFESLPVGEHCFNVRALNIGDYTCIYWRLHLHIASVRNGMRRDSGDSLQHSAGFGSKERRGSHNNFVELAGRC